ncbi:MAG: histidine kinase [Deltaproteobacteria bacterium]|nr:histidine kinase [Deltaproteobacteria bacterium]MBW2117790.1 histidine kinase [Deltaproteobacteria bacterium]MBW2343757.1 histidine kinase [Deltaproteobacteria bacterium]
MWKRINLRVRIYIILTALVFITLVGGSVTVWYTYRMQFLLTHIIDRNVAAFQAAEALEMALVNQKGFVSYYFLDGDPDWLRQLGEYRRIFKEKLNEARALIDTEEQRKAINRIESEYIKYITAKDRVIVYYKAGERKIGARLHREVRNRFFKILDLCESYKDFQTERIKEARAGSRAQANRLRITAVTGMLIVLLLALLLTFVLVSRILGPVRRLALEADPEGGSKRAENEVKALNQSVRGLIKEYDHTQIELVRSREHLLQAEKMALVGKLAAGMAHSIRNPLTSVKMRLFSLSRTLEMLDPQKEDFEVISDEIRHIDTIVENFLEFSRPPKLKMQRVSPSDVVDLAIKLLEHRLQSYEVEIKLQRRLPLPEIQTDPEQLKEVLVNLVVNACEAMEGGGLIVIHEEKSFVEPLGKVVVIRLTDNGPGIPESIQDKVLQPFFTTKEEGTGLGLSIATRIVEQHGGWLDLTSKEGEGTTFVITLPVKE